MNDGKILRWIVPAVVVSLLGLGYLQVSLLRDAYDQHMAAFGRTVINVLQQVAGTIESREIRSRITSLLVTTGDTSQNIVTATVSTGEQGPTSSGAVRMMVSAGAEFHDSVYYRNGMFCFERYIGGSDSARLLPPELPSREGPMTSVLVRKFVVGASGRDSIVVKTSAGGKDSSHRVMEKELVASMLDVLNSAERNGVTFIVQKGYVDSLLRDGFSGAGITIPYDFGLISGKPPSVRFASDSTRSAELAASEFATPLFPTRMFSSGSRLVVLFPQRDVFILRKIIPSLLATLIFMLLILGSFIAVITLVRRQKRFARRLTDFVNNITHEFKTPISTISVVTDTLAHPEISGMPEKVAHYNSIVRDEIGRLKAHVDRILQLAVLEEGDYEFRFEMISPDDIVRDAVDGFRLRIGGRNGSIHLAAHAEGCTVRADSYHFRSIITNLLDNADKYSPDPPEITITTLVSGERYRLEVADHGIGISAADQAHLFEKYYRVSTGDRHDTKGFGLGLSYVQMIVAAHRGTVSVRSSPGEGTAIIVELPLSGQ